MKCIVVRKEGRFGDSAMYNGIFDDNPAGEAKAEEYRKRLQDINDAENSVEPKPKRKKI